jgi:anti-sigma factor RsiW
MMSCKELVEVVTEYLEGTMPPNDRERFEAHLAVCPYCVDYVEQLRSVIGVLGRAPSEPVEAGTQERLLKAFRNWKSTKRTQ